MGVNLRSIAEPKKIELENLRGKKIAIDAFNALYQFLSIIRGMTGDLLRDDKGRVTSHLSGLFYRNMNLLETGIKMVYVFDGTPPRLKSLEVLDGGKSKNMPVRCTAKHSKEKTMLLQGSLPPAPLISIT